MKRTCIAPLCIAVLVAHHAANAQENGSVKSDEVARTSLDCNRQSRNFVSLSGSTRWQAGRSTTGITGVTATRAHDWNHKRAPKPQRRFEGSPDSQGALQPPEKEAVAILELGAEPARSLSGGGWSLSPTVAAEVTPIENWLELEFGVTPTFSHRSTEWDTDLLFKKPWTLSKKVEFMLGAGLCGFTSGRTASAPIQWPARLRLTLCSGRRPSAGSAGISSRHTITGLGAATISRSA